MSWLDQSPTFKTHEEAPETLQAWPRVATREDLYLSEARSALRARPLVPITGGDHLGYQEAIAIDRPAATDGTTGRFLFDPKSVITYDFVILVEPTMPQATMWAQSRP